MSQAEQGDTVSIHYTGRLDDGTVFDSSESRGPLEFTLGEDEVIPGFESAVLGMEEGDEKTATLSPEEAYGHRRDDLVLTMPLERLPEDLDPEVGQRLEMRTDEGRTFEVVVTEVGDDRVLLDANHPLAGEELTFDIELVEIA